MSDHEEHEAQGGDATNSATKTWTGPGEGGEWDDPANWTPEGVPGPGDVVDLPAAIREQLVARAHLSGVTVGERGVVLALEDEEQEEQAQAPVLPWEIHLNSAGVFFQPRRGGGMQMKFAVAARTPMGMVPTSPAVAIEFGPEEWEAHKAAVLADGVVEAKPRIETATHLPPGFRV